MTATRFLFTKPRLGAGVRALAARS